MNPFSAIGNSIGSFANSLLDGIRNVLPSQSYSYNFGPNASPGPQQMSMIGTPAQIKLTMVPHGTLSTTPLSSPSPTTQAPASAAPSSGFQFNYNSIPRPSTTPFQPSQPPTEYANLLRQNFPQEATPAALVANTENFGWNPNAQNVNTDGSIDRGLMQINSNSFNGLLARRGPEMAALGVNNFDQMFNPKLNVEVGKMIHDEGGWGRWFGWQNQGYNLLGKK